MKCISMKLGKHICWSVLASENHFVTCEPIILDTGFIITEAC